MARGLSPIQVSSPTWEEPAGINLSAPGWRSHRTAARWHAPSQMIIRNKNIWNKRLLICEFHPNLHCLKLKIPNLIHLEPLGMTKSCQVFQAFLPIQKVSRILLRYLCWGQHTLACDLNERWRDLSHNKAGKPMTRTTPIWHDMSKQKTDVSLEDQLSHWSVEIDWLVSVKAGWCLKRFYLLHLIRENRVTITQHIFVYVTLKMYLFENVPIQVKPFICTLPFYNVMKNIWLRVRRTDKSRSRPRVVAVGKITALHQYGNKKRKENNVGLQTCHKKTVQGEIIRKYECLVILYCMYRHSSKHI